MHPYGEIWFWPETNTSADQISFHAALLDPESNLLVAYDNVEWGW
jgi:hypothetical protein